jgi:3-oxoacyl-ACP reductase-like protein
VNRGSKGQEDAQKGSSMSSSAATAAAAVTSAPGAAGDGTVEAADLLVVIVRLQASEQYSRMGYMD